MLCPKCGAPLNWGAILVNCRECGFLSIDLSFSVGR